MFILINWRGDLFASFIAGWPLVFAQRHYNQTLSLLRVAIEHIPIGLKRLRMV